MTIEIKDAVVIIQNYEGQQNKLKIVCDVTEGQLYHGYRYERESTTRMADILLEGNCRFVGFIERT